MQGCVLNVYINTKSMKNREKADSMNEYVKNIVEDGVERLTKVYNDIEKSLYA